MLEHIDRLQGLRATWQLVHTTFVRHDDRFGTDVVENSEVVENFEGARLRAATLSAHSGWQRWKVGYLYTCAALARTEERFLVDDTHADAVLHEREREDEACRPRTSLQ